MMTFGSLFSGIGGFDLGFERAGMPCKWQCEIDPKASEVLAKHWPEVKRYTDVRSITKHNTEPVDVICGGFPCQDLSIAGKRKGLAGERSGLWFEFARIIDELEPKWVVIENVPGLLSSNNGADFAVVIRWLVKRGYGVCWRILDSQYFGVAQRRRRVFIVASFGSGRSAEVLFESEGLSWDTPARGETGQTVAGTFTVRSGSDGGGKGYHGLDDGAMTLGGQPQWVTGTLDAKSCSGNRGSQGNETEFLVSPTLRKAIGGTVSYGRDAIVMSSGQANAEITEDISPTGYRMTAFGEYDDDDTASTETVHQHKDATDLVCYSGVRRLTPTECSRLQGFPDDWNSFQADSSRYKQYGNAVTVNVAEWIGRRIVEASL